MTGFLKSLKIFKEIPKGCLAIGQILLGKMTLGGAPSHMCVLGRSINNIPYLIDPQSSRIYPEGAFASAVVQEIFEYVKKVGATQLNFINSR